MIGFRYCVFLASGLTLIGCVSINSKLLEDRMCAVAKLTTQEELLAAVWKTDYEDVRISAVKRVAEQQALAAIVEAPRFSDEVKCIALSAITNQAYLADVAVADTSSEKHAEIAVRGISCAPLLYKCAKKTRFEDVAVACVEKLNDEMLLKQISLDAKVGVRCRERCLTKIRRESILCDIALGSSEAWVHDIVVPRLVESSSACRIIVAPNISDALKVSIVGKITDETFLVAFVEDKGHRELIRRKCLEKIGREDCCTLLLRHTPVLEDWVVFHAISHIINGDTLIETVLNREFNDKNRTLAFTKLKSRDEFEKVFEMARDDLPVNQSVRRLSHDYVNSKRGQTSLARNFRIVGNDLLSGELLLLMQEGTLAGLYKRSDQTRIARAIAASSTTEVLAVARKALFDDAVILDLALGNFSNDDRITYWALDLNPSESVMSEVALKSKNLSTQCRALARISEEDQIVRIALYGKKLALRAAAIARLSKKSEQVLNELAQDSNVAIKTAAIERLKFLGGADAAKLERRAEIERKEKVAKARKEAEERKAREEREKEDFEKRYLLVAGTPQIRIVRKYVELNAKAHIESPIFLVTGRVVQLSGRDVALKMYCEDGEVQVAVEMKRKVSGAFAVGEIVTISGYDDRSITGKYRFRCGELVERGIQLK